MSVAHFTRRWAIALLLVLATPLANSPAGAEQRYEPIRTDDGLLAQPWFLNSFLDLQEDLKLARENGKRFVVMWEQRGCPYCKETHEVNFAIPAIQHYVRENFEVLQLNIWGSRTVTDFDGEELEERKLARKYGVNFTPTIQFFPESVPADTDKGGKALEVQRMPGYFKPFHFLAMFRYVGEEAYGDSSFQDYLETARSDLKAEGVAIESW